MTVCCGHMPSTRSTASRARPCPPPATRPSCPAPKSWRSRCCRRTACEPCKHACPAAGALGSARPWRSDPRPLLRDPHVNTLQTVMTMGSLWGPGHGARCQLQAQLPARSPEPALGPDRTPAEDGSRAGVEQLGNTVWVTVSLSPDVGSAMTRWFRGRSLTSGLTLPISEWGPCSWLRRVLSRSGCDGLCLSLLHCGRRREREHGLPTVLVLPEPWGGVSEHLVARRSGQCP